MITAATACSDASSSPEIPSATDKVISETTPVISETVLADTALLGETAPESLPPLTDAPAISLTDPLSSQLNEYELRSGNYSWAVPQGKETMEMIACGMHPLDSGTEQEPLKVPVYQKQDSVLYWINCSYTPDEFTLTEWNSADLGNLEAEPLSSITFTESSCELKKGRIYQLTLTWDRKHLEKRGFAGEASYRFITE